MNAKQQTVCSGSGRGDASGNAPASGEVGNGSFGEASLTTDEIAELRGVLKGADVWGYANAKRLRSIQQKAPELIDIVPAMEKPPGHMRQPYFGCIATLAGRQFLRAIDRAKRNARCGSAK